jgi:hypothetical protein
MLPGTRAGDEQLHTLKRRKSSREDEPVFVRERGTASAEDRGALGNKEFVAGGR